MNSMKIKYLCERGILFFILLLIQICCVSCINTVTNERRQDVEILTRLCLESTNDIQNTQELFELAQRKHVKLYSPIPKVSNQPCYRLVWPYIPNAKNKENVIFPNRLLIEETNVTDPIRRYASTYDGSVFLKPLK